MLQLIADSRNVFHVLHDGAVVTLIEGVLSVVEGGEAKDLRFVMSIDSAVQLMSDIQSWIADAQIENARLKLEKSE